MSPARVLCLLALSACAAEEPAPSETTGEPVEPGAHVNATVDFATHCGGSDALRLVATRVDCAVAGPCTIAKNPYTTFESDDVMCDVGGTTISATVEQSGRYAVELRAVSGDTVDTQHCWATTNTATSLIVTQSQIDDAATIPVERVSMMACPEPAP
jgi:hypothetical protein